ncbi:MAG: hypothetical protein OXF95_03485 [Rhodobacteraceae bacterium]|nr:hypothetical protein [Paracoccaceae bacterium]
MSNKKTFDVSNNPPWSNDELKIAIEVYLYLLRLQQSGVSFPAKEMDIFVAKTLLPNRNDASVRYRLRNISYVFEKKNLPILHSYTPAPNIGLGIRNRIETILEQCLVDSKELFENQDLITSASLESILEKLDKLDRLFSKIDKDSRVGIGHNNPPESITELNIGINVKLSIQNIKKELNSNSPDKSNIKKDQNEIIKLGLWIMEKLIGGGIAAAGAMLFYQILDVLKSLATFF